MIENKKFEEKNTFELLQKLSNEIFQKFWIDIQKAQFLIKTESINSLENLKKELKAENKFLENDKIEELFLKLKEFKNILESASKNEIPKLKYEVEEQIDIDNFQNSLEWKNILPRKLVKIARNPEKPHEHLLWASLGLANSVVAVWSAIINTWIWILKSPYDLYLLASWKWELENAKKI